MTGDDDRYGRLYLEWKRQAEGAGEMKRYLDQILNDSRRRKNNERYSERYVTDMTSEMLSNIPYQDETKLKDGEQIKE